MLTTAQLFPAPAAVRAATAWWLPGGDPAVWLEEIARWPVATEAVQFVLLATDNGEAVAGVLAIPPAGTKVPPGGGALAYGEVAPGFYVPVEARISPPLAAEELQAVARYARQVWHPALGLTGVEAHEVVSAAHWLAAPTLLDEDWSGARAGEAREWRLRSVRRRAELNLAEVFGEESKDIGSKADEPLPSSPGERTPGPVAKTLLGGAALAGAALLKLTSLLPRTARAPTWINALEAWMQQRLGGISRQLEAARHAELLRLMKLLEKNPEEGLRHAISLAALAQRGRAPAAGRLDRRASLDFQLGRVGGGGVSDPWSVPEDIRSSLSRSYREQAMRELKLGRHRRAACILAELLGDLSGAADALRQGRHFQEAALLYRDRLNQPVRAAECFVEAGLLHEAVALFEQHERWLEAADVYVRLGDTAAEHAAVRRVVAAHREKGDVVGAARLLEDRLAAPDEALALLAATWPGGKQAIACLEERFTLLGRHQREVEVQALVQKLGNETVSPGFIAGLVAVLGKLTEHGGSAPVRRLAGEAVLVQASRALTARRLNSADELAVLRAVTRLAPGDRLLVRDVVRFRAPRTPPPPSSALRAPATPPRLVRKYALGEAGTLQLLRMHRAHKAAAEANRFFVAGETSEGRPLVVAGGWQSHLAAVEWKDVTVSRYAPLILAAGRVCVAAQRFGAALEPRAFSATDAPELKLNAGTPPWWPADAVQADWSPTSLWVVRVVESRVVLACFHEGSLTGSHDVTDELTEAGATGGGTGLSLSAGGGYGRVALGYGEHLLVLENQRTVRVQPMGARVLGLVPVQGVVAGWIVLLERGAVFATADGSTTWTLDGDLEQPRAVVLRGGEVVLVGSERGGVWRLGEKQAERIGHFDLPGGAGAGLLPTEDAEVFAVCGEDGKLRRWRLKLNS